MHSLSAKNNKQTQSDLLIAEFKGHENIFVLGGYNAAHVPTYIYIYIRILKTVPIILVFYFK